MHMLAMYMHAYSNKQVYNYIISYNYVVAMFMIASEMYYNYSYM